MIRVGMVDRWLDNWHTSHYPDYLRLAAQQYGFDLDITDVWAEQDAPNGMTAEQWCAVHQARPAASYEELLDRVDAVMVMCADDCLPHEELAGKALDSGKPVFCDKTFAPTHDAARRMFDRAGQHGTPLFSCSAQRFCMELLNWQRLSDKKADFCATTGPGDLINYSIHQFEMLEAAMGPGALRCRAATAGGVVQVSFEYPGGRFASFTQGTGFPFRMLVSRNGRGEDIAVTDYYMNFMYALCRFFLDRIPPVTREDTLEIMALQQAARTALGSTDGLAEVLRER